MKKELPDHNDHVPSAESRSIPDSVDENSADVTPNDALRDLADIWRGMADNRIPEQNQITLEWCADDLEKLIE